MGDYLTGDSHQGDCSPGQSTRDTIGRRGRPALANLPSSSPSCAVLKPPATLPAEGRNSPWRPGFLSFGCVLLLYLVIGWKTSRNPYQHQFLSWYTSVVWTLPFLTSALGLTGVLVTARRVRGGRLITETPAARVLGLRLSHLRQVNVPLYAIQTALGGNNNALKTAARAMKRASRIPSLTFVDKRASYGHLDPLLAAPAHNAFLQTVVPWLQRIPVR